MAQVKTVICFCKHPEIGMVKSRLSTHLGEEHAVDIYRILLNTTLQNIDIKGLKIILYCYPDIHHTFFNYCKNEYNVTLKNQEGNDLGARMYNAISDYLNTKQNIVLIGSDCLELNPDYINDAFLALEKGSDIVLGPTLDGGYALIGAKRIHASLFNDISWSSNRVLQETVEKINSLEWKLTCLPLIQDLDVLTDYQYFSQHKKFKHLFLHVNKAV